MRTTQLSELGRPKTDVQSYNSRPASKAFTDFAAEKEMFLKYSLVADQSKVLSGSSDYGLILGLKEAILKLKNDYFSGAGSVIIKGDERPQLDKRFLLFEHELDGLLRRRIQFSAKDYEGGTRNLDFTTLLNEKQNQVVELEKQIQNYQQRLNRAATREIELQNRVKTLNADLLSSRDKSLTGRKLDTAVQQLTQIEQLVRENETLRNNFASAASIWKNQLKTIQEKYSGERLELNYEITALLQNTNVSTYNIKGVETIQVKSEKTVQVPAEDSRSKALLHALSANLKKLSQKYPKLLTELDPKITEYFQQELIDVIEVGQIDRLIQIVKYVPQTVRVENIYAYSSSKSRKVEFHLRVLVKALLEELEKMRAKSGIVLEMDEAVIAMIKQEIMEIVDVDDILKVFRVNPKIVEVEKVVEKVVDRFVEVPQVVPIEKVVEKVIEVPKVQEVERVVHVPVEIVKVVDNVVEKIVDVPRIQERVVEVPRVTEKVVERVVEVPKVVEVEKIVEKVVVNTEVVTVEKPVYHVTNNYNEVVVEKEKVVTVEKVVEKIVEVPVYIQKIVEKVVEVEKIRPVEQIIEKVIEVVKPQIYEKENVIVNNVPQIIEKVVEKVVVVENVVEKIKEVPQIVEKIVQVTIEVPKIVEIERIVEKLVPVIEIREIEKVNNVVVPLVKEVEKVVERRIQIPVIQQRIITVPEIINQVVVERIEVPKIIEVERWCDKIITETKLIEVEKPIVHYIRDVQIVKAVVEKIVQVPKTIQRIKEVKVKVEKIVEKFVQVPRVVEVEKLVDKIIVVPRIIDKIVEVPQIIEVIVEKIVEVEHIREVQVNNQVPYEVEKPVEVEIFKNIYAQIERPVEKMVEKIVPVEKVIKQVQVVENVIQRIVSATNQVPKEIVVEKVVPVIVETQVFIEVEKPVTLTVEVPVEVEKIVEKPILINQIHEKILQVPEVIEKVIEVQVESTEIKEVERIVDKIVEKNQVQIVTEKEYIIEEKIKEVPTFQEKIVEVKETIRQEIPVEQIVEKITEVVVEIPKVVEIEKIVQKMVLQDQIVEVDKVIVQPVNVHQVVKEVVEKIVTVPYREEVIKEVPVEVEKIIQVSNSDVEVREVPTLREKVVQVDRVKQVTNVVNHIEKQVQVVDRFEEKTVPVYSTVEKIVEVPQVLEKIVERIVVMPQVVEVLKYVHEIYEQETLGAAITGDVQVAELKYREVYTNAKKQLQALLVELKKLQSGNPSLKTTIQSTRKYLLEFDRLAAAQRIVSVPNEKVVQKKVEKGVLVPVNDVRGELAMSLLVEKLILEIKRIKKENNNVNLELDKDIGYLFFAELYDGGNSSGGISADFKASLQKYTDEAIQKFTRSGGSWTRDHELMLHTVLAERFAMANTVNFANQEIEKVKAIAELKGRALHENQNQLQETWRVVRELHKALNDLQKNMPTLAANSTFSKAVENIKNLIDSKATASSVQPTKLVSEGSTTDHNNMLNYLRERSQEIDHYKAKLIELEKQSIEKGHKQADAAKTIETLKAQNAELTKQINDLRSQVAREEHDSTSLKNANSKITELQAELKAARQPKNEASHATLSTLQQQNLHASNSLQSTKANQYGGNQSSLPWTKAATGTDNKTEKRHPSFAHIKNITASKQTAGLLSPKSLVKVLSSDSFSSSYQAGSELGSTLRTKGVYANKSQLGSISGGGIAGNGKIDTTYTTKGTFNKLHGIQSTDAKKQLSEESEQYGVKGSDDASSFKSSYKFQTKIIGSSQGIEPYVFQTQKH